MVHYCAWQWTNDDRAVPPAIARAPPAGGRCSSRPWPGSRDVSAELNPGRVNRSCLLGLLSRAERKNCRQLAEQAGPARPGPMQRLLRYARWDADAVRDDIRAYAVEHLGTDSGVLRVDETGFVKKGLTPAGVQRQYTGTAGRIENSQAGVLLACASGRGRTLIGRRLCLPGHSGCADAERRPAAGTPDEARLRTKLRLTREMIAAALDAGAQAPWVTGDEAYGQDPQLRAALEARGTGYVMPVACSTRARIDHGRTTLAPTLSPAVCPPPPGSGTAQATARRARATTTGPGSTSAPADTTTRSSAATTPPANSPSTCAGHPPKCPWPNSSPSPVSAGAPRSASRPPRATP
ncbi:IS701 family transposase [Streptomyces sp. NPDC001508]|uniref:IS701 family transposase n=1 Tax=Streptomyces sp. NPDC001508 TaxID=3154656 RepID=UPI00331B3F9B